MKNKKKILAAAGILVLAGVAAVCYIQNRDKKEAASIGIIGGADGPTAVIFGASSQGKLCTACSALHFEPVQHDIEWRITFHEKRFADFTCTLLI